MLKLLKHLRHTAVKPYAGRTFLIGFLIVYSKKKEHNFLNHSKVENISKCKESSTKNFQLGTNNP